MAYIDDLLVNPVWWTGVAMVVLAGSILLFLYCKDRHRCVGELYRDYRIYRPCIRCCCARTLAEVQPDQPDPPMAEAFSVV